MELRLIKFKEEVQFLPSNNEKKKWQYFDVSDNLYPPIKHSFLQHAYDTAVPFHDYVNHVRSSQIFGINLLFPLLSDQKGNGHKALIELMNKKLKTEIKAIESFQFEYSPDDDWLGEWPGKTKPSEYITSADVFIIAAAGNQKIGILLEVKFTESEFGACNGITSNGCSSEDRANCDDFTKVKHYIDNCYLHKKHKARSARKYFTYFDMDSDVRLENNLCPFRNNNQCIRNHALARALKKFGDMNAFFGLIYFDGNETINTQWNQYLKVMNNSSELFSIKASEVVDAYGAFDSTYKLYFQKRYGI